MEFISKNCLPFIVVFVVVFVSPINGIPLLLRRV